MTHSGADEPSSGPALSVAFSAIGRSVKFAAAASTPAALTSARDPEEEDKSATSPKQMECFRRVVKQGARGARGGRDLGKGQVPGLERLPRHP